MLSRCGRTCSGLREASSPGPGTQRRLWRSWRRDDLAIPGLSQVGAPGPPPVRSTFPPPGGEEHTSGLSTCLFHQERSHLPPPQTQTCPRVSQSPALDPPSHAASSGPGTVKPRSWRRRQQRLRRALQRLGGPCVHTDGVCVCTYM